MEYSSFIELDTLVVAFDLVFFAHKPSGQRVELHQCLRERGLETTRYVGSRRSGPAHLVVWVVQDERNEHAGAELV